jgi:hypothetical protein
MNIYKIDVLGHAGPIRAVFIPKGVPNPNYPGMDSMASDERALVEFYDLRYAGPKFTPDGQFITRYSATTLLEPLETRGLNRGLCLNGGVSDWSIGPRPYSVVLIWLAYLFDL